MSKSMTIASHQGDYQVFFQNQISFDAIENQLSSYYFVIDKKVASLYAIQLKKILAQPSTLLIEATELNKSLHQFPTYVEHFVKHKIRRNHRLVAIGGGIIQDITCFLSATLLRGIEWWFYPTTLLAQADSCIGSKSSINCGEIKNILGTFTPPKQIFICTEFLSSLSQLEIKSGIGEMLKVHVIESQESFNQLRDDYKNIFIDSTKMQHYIYRSLEIKKSIIEQDEFDRGVRNIMNYGHTFGHAIESATKYHIPHGIAVSFGMDMANYISAQFNYGLYEHFTRMHSVLKQNYDDYLDVEIPLDSFIQAISKDKKNKDGNLLGLILPDKFAKPTRVYFENDELFKKYCRNYFSEISWNL